MDRHHLFFSDNLFLISPCFISKLHYYLSTDFYLIGWLVVV